ncbi:uncharacterized protein PHALS_00718 [Plasmopara halstedii]|uniref:Uncharacterized protein n=1 Tax=Plasmopara halstedii TaxID=4781 RepID=A0A0P1ATC2_PLAHL|nr:uncharacterized protein PHALS_00718 [Plasmopara halstedii]CEG44349.1 hypothetical protein PHALS_00718 [Plasmopara halstedii]|eukprot:XP_024580718.1 hypothetical protein PHALS_00718 [Plasmopara halstedii]
MSNTNANILNIMRQVSDPLQRIEYIVLWILLMSCHGLCAAFLLIQARIYFFLEDPLMAYYANLLAIPERRYFRLFGALGGGLGVLHQILLILHVLWSVISQSLTVFPRIEIVNRLLQCIQRHVQFTNTRSDISSLCGILTFLKTISIAALQGILDIQGDYFVEIFLLRKVAEASAQIVQCYHYSTLIGQVWINNLYTAAVVLNCWITPILDYFMLKSDIHTIKEEPNGILAMTNVGVSIRMRTFCVMVDTLLTIMTCLAFPVAIFVPYARTFSVELLSFPNEILYDDVAFPNLVHENQAVFALNFLDGVTKLIPHLSILLGTASISLVLEYSSPHRFKNRLGQRKVFAKKSVAAFKPEIDKKPNCFQTYTVKYSYKCKRPECAIGWVILRRVVVPIVFIVAGVLLLGLHLNAIHLSTSVDPDTIKICRQGLRPWFAVNVSCSVLEFSCYDHGVISPSNDALDHFQSDSVAVIVFAHCSDFVMPSVIRQFQNLLGLELWNVSITKWDIDAALNADLHPNMVYLIMAYTNMSEMPRGILTKPFPPLLDDIEMSITNLQVVPKEVAETWANVKIVYLEHTPLKEFPIPLFQIGVRSVSLLNNGLKDIPNDLFTTVSFPNEYFEVCFSYNVIETLPSKMRESLSISYLSLDHTKLKKLSVWASTCREQIALGGSPICKDMKAVIPDIADCTDSGWNPMLEGRYPLQLIASFRAIT